MLGDLSINAAVRKTIGRRSEADRNSRRRSLQILSRFSGRSPEHTNKYHKLGEKKKTYENIFDFFNFFNFTILKTLHIPVRKISKQHNFKITSLISTNFWHKFWNNDYEIYSKIHNKLTSLKLSRSTLSDFKMSLSVFKCSFQGIKVKVWLSWMSWSWCTLPITSAWKET